jgi:ubiquinone/menaquinone biosynthesis C-methylase UbiE
METQQGGIKLELREWNAKAYDKGHSIQTKAFLHFLKENTIIIKNRTILDAACGPGRIAAQLAQQARSVHGFDASNNMITLAQKNYKHITNVSFEQRFAETFTSPQLYQLGIMSSCFHWFQNKKMALQCMYNSLAPDGEFFADIYTTQDPMPLNLTVFNEMCHDIMEIQDHFKNYSSNDCDCSYPSLDELKITLRSTGFDIIKAEIQSVDYCMTKEEFTQFQCPIVKSKRGVGKMSLEQFNKFFEVFINRCLSKLKKNNDNTYTFPFTVTIVHARKVKK